MLWSKVCERLRSLRGLPTPSLTGGVRREAEPLTVAHRQNERTCYMESCHWNPRIPENQGARGQPSPASFSWGVVFLTFISKTPCYHEK